MQIICHRRNKIEELKSTPTQYGVEIDIRSFGERLVVHHDPFVEGDDLQEWIANYRHKTLILNVKEEGLEDKILDLLKKYGIQDYFFLDQSFPFLIKYSRVGIRKCAVRISEYESIETALSLAGKVDWIWIDCFDKFPLTSNDSKLLQSRGFKLCIVSPELQGRNPEIEIPEMSSFFEETSLSPEAVCTKRPDLWKNFCL